MTPEEIKQIIIATAGTNRGGPATAKFCRMFSLSQSIVRQHLNGSKPPNKFARAFYRLLGPDPEEKK
jgi:hypothetical protein